MNDKINETTDSTFKDSEHFKELVNFLLDAKINIAELAKSALETMLFATDIRPNTFLCGVQGLYRGRVTLFKGITKTIDPVFSLTNKIFDATMDNVHLNNRSITPEDKCVIRIISMCLAINYLYAIDNKKLRYAITRKGDGSHHLRLSITREATTELYNRFKDQPLTDVVHSLLHDFPKSHKCAITLTKHDDDEIYYDYKFTIDEIPYPTHHKIAQY